jgi:hypothetical protein
MTSQATEPGAEWVASLRRIGYFSIEMGSVVGAAKPRAHAPRRKTRPGVLGASDRMHRRIRPLSGNWACLGAEPRWPHRRSARGSRYGLEGGKGPEVVSIRLI